MKPQKAGTSLVFLDRACFPDPAPSHHPATLPRVVALALAVRTRSLHKTDSGQYSITPHHLMSPQITPCHPTSPHITPCHPTSPHISPCHPMPPPHHPMVPHVTPYHPTSPHVECPSLKQQQLCVLPCSDAQHAGSDLFQDVL